MRLRLLSRKSDLAVLQTEEVADALRSRWPTLQVELQTRSSRGDRDARAALWQSEHAGLFTSDLSQALVEGDAEAAVHSWKDLPIAGIPGTTIAASIARADPRDVLLVRGEVVEHRPTELTILTSSPRRAWQLQRAVASLLPWEPVRVEATPVRGNVPTRLARLLQGDGDALVVAKAALDRLLSPRAPAEASLRVRTALDACRWMVLPLRDFPTAPGQGALAIEVASQREDVRELIGAISNQDTRSAVEAERRILANNGGGCGAAVGATILTRPYGTVTSVRGRLETGTEFATWSLDSSTPAPPPATGAVIWPRPEERASAVRKPLDVIVPVDTRGWWIARADALPETARPGDAQVVWAAGIRTWHRLAARGIWVHGCSDGLGDAEAPGVEGLAGRAVDWLRLTHAGSGVPGALATYEVRTPLPPDLGSRTHFFWTSGSLFLEAVRQYPQIRQGWHGCGPGRTARVVLDTLGDAARVRIWLDYEQWLTHVLR